MAYLKQVLIPAGRLIWLRTNTTDGFYVGYEFYASEVTPLGDDRYELTMTRQLPEGVSFDGARINRFRVCDKAMNGTNLSMTVMVIRLWTSSMRLEDPAEFTDTDGDGIGNNADPDDDNDGVADDQDVFPLDAAETADADGDDNVAVITPTMKTLSCLPSDDESVDTDGDGIGNNADSDDDNDGFTDDEELSLGSDPTSDTSDPERDALVAFYQANGDIWTNNTNWIVEDDVCTCG